MIVQHNLTAMNSNRMLGLTTAAQAKSTEKLSSGYKINRAADDAAGLAISEKMRRQVRGLTQASANAQDGISAVQTAEGALTEVHDMLQRMNELATKSANGTNSQEERDYIQSEVDALIDEIDRVSETTKFNEIYLLKGAADEAGAAAETPAVKKTVTMNETAKKLMELKVAFKADKADAELYGAGETEKVTASTAAGTKGTMTLTATPAYATKGNAADGSTATQVTAANINEYFQVNSRGEVSLKDGVDLWNAAANNLATKITDTADLTTLVTGGTEDVPATTGNLDQYVEIDKDGNLKYKDGKKLYTVPADTENQHGAQTINQDGKAIAETDLGTYFEPKGTPIRTGEDADSPALAENADMSAYFDEYGVYKGGLYLADDTGAMKEIGADQITKYFTFTDAEGEGGASAGPALEVALHVGADSDSKNKITVTIEAMSAKGIGIDALRSKKGKEHSGGVSSEDSATQAIDTIKNAIKKVSQQRSDLGAVQNRLEHTINNLDNVVENTTSAESAIRDTDMATEMVRYANNNILAQAGQTMLAQANQANQGVLALLG